MIMEIFPLFNTIEKLFQVVKIENKPEKREWLFFCTIPDNRIFYKWRKIWKFSFRRRKNLKLKTELPLEVAKIICHFYVEIHENLSAYYSKRSIFQDSKNNLTLLEIYIILRVQWRNMVQEGWKRIIIKWNHIFESFAFSFPTNHIFIQTFHMKTQHFFHKSWKLFELKVT